MKFLNEDIRKEFHLLPLDKQRALTDCDERFAQKGFELHVVCVEIVDEVTSEISVRIYQKSHIT